MIPLGIQVCIEKTKLWLGKKFYWVSDKVLLILSGQKILKILLGLTGLF